MVSATLTFDRFGVPDEAYNFNGVDEYIDLPNAPELKPELPVSVAFWMKFDDFSPQNTVLFTTDFAQNNHTGVWMNLSSDGRLAIAYGDNTGNTTSSNRRSKVGNSYLETGVWYHIVGVVNGPTDMELYINCENDMGSYSGSGENLGYTSNPGSLGRKDAHYQNPAHYFKGALDDFYMWNKALSYDEVLLLAGGCCESVVASMENVDPICFSGEDVPLPNAQPSGGIYTIDGTPVEFINPSNLLV